VTAHGLTAYRVWALDPPAQSPLLKSANNDMPWLPYEWTRADCFLTHRFDADNPHDPPRERCSCGIYATKALAMPVMMAGANERIMVGRVELAGKVIEHDSGYRAELARVVELLPKPGQESVAEWIASVYGVPASDGLIRMWGSFNHGPPIEPIVRAHRVVLAAKSPRPGLLRSAKLKRQMPMPRSPRASGIRACLIWCFVVLSLVINSRSSQSAPHSRVPAAPAVAPASPPPGVPVICPNTNPLNCYLDPAALTKYFQQFDPNPRASKRASARRSASASPMRMPRTS